jgi:FtsH-binding integral membrane protein
MREVIQRSFQLLLDEMGIDEKRQFMLGVFVGLVALVVYSVRERHQHGLLITFLFTMLGLAALVFLFTESEAARHWSALIASLAIVAILTGEFIRRRRAAAASSEAAAAGAQTSSAAAGQSS